MTFDWSIAPKYIVTKLDGTPLPAGEPVFVLRAQDRLAADIVAQYAGAYELFADLPEEERREKADLIRQHAYAMSMWPGRKWPS